MNTDTANFVTGKRKTRKAAATCRPRRVTRRNRTRGDRVIVFQTYPELIFTDAKGEREFVEELDVSTEVKVYATLPRGSSIPTPVGDYHPHWAIVFDAGKVRHIDFIAETKGGMSKLELRPIKESQIECARKLFAKITTNDVKYDAVNCAEKLMELVK